MSNNDRTAKLLFFFFGRGGVCVCVCILSEYVGQGTNGYAPLATCFMTICAADPHELFKNVAYSPYHSLHVGKQSLSPQYGLKNVSSALNYPKISAQITHNSFTTDGEVTKTKQW